VKEAMLGGRGVKGIVLVSQRFWILGRLLLHIAEGVELGEQG
jgi:hypothetical protein